MLIAEYLHTTHRPDCDFLEGEVRERHRGEYEHSIAMGELMNLLSDKDREFQLRVLPSCRMWINPQRIRVTDICVVPRSQPKQGILVSPPLLCVEITSSYESLQDVRLQVDDYLAMGVEQVWVVDPWTRVGYHATADGYVLPEDGLLRVPGTEIAVSLTDLFAAMDEA